MSEKKFMTINGNRVEFTNESNVLKIIRNAGIDLPTFCYHSELSIHGACRMCSVEDERGNIFASCSERPREGMCIMTHSPRLKKYRRMILELLLSNHDRECTKCEITGSCQLQSLAHRYGISEIRFDNNYEEKPIDQSSPSIVRNPNKCIKCGDCVLMCEEVQGVGAIGFIHRGSDVEIAPAFGKTLLESNCVNCGQCRIVCPTGAIRIKNDIDRVWDVLYDKNKKVVCQVAPAVRVALGEEFGYDAGEVSVGKMVTALHMLGFEQVFDTALAADLTVREEGSEFLKKLAAGEGLPLFTSCCPAWVKFVENKYPEYIGNLSSARSPQQIFGSVYKEYMKANPEDDREVVLISVMPCTAKKEECTREDFRKNGVPDVDIVITTQELAMMIKELGIHFRELPEHSFDMPFGVASGAGIIFGSTGGVMEAVLRDVVGDALDKLTLGELYENVRGLEEVREAVIDMQNGRSLRLAVVHGLKNADRLLKGIKAGERYYDIVEVMSCRGGCVSGGGQPINRTPAKKTRQERAKGLYKIDSNLQIKRSKDNYVMKQLYEGILKDNEQIMHIHRVSKKSSTKEVE